MRMRRKKHREERIAACGDYFMKEEEISLRGTYLEIGCGKGDFITTLAARYPDRRYIAIEKNADVALLAAEKAVRAGLTNLRFFIGDAKPLLEMQEGGCLGIFINFSDPWPKEGHRRRRLTHPIFLNLYRRILVPGGEVHMKTDNRKLFQYSLNSFSEEGYRLRNISLDLHSDHFPENIETEYERLFSEQGFPIYRLEAIPN